MSDHIKRVIHYGFTNFFRNTFVSFSTVFIISVTLFVLGISILGGALLQDSLERVREKVDVAVYFVPGISEDVITEYRGFVEELEGVDGVRFVSQNEALAEYRRRHAEDEELLAGLDELGVNPLRARLHITAEDPSFYSKISEDIQNYDLFSEESSTVIDKIDYFENMIIIDRLSSLTSSGERAITTVLVFLIIVAFLITLVTIRLTIYSVRDEVSLVNLVGAGRFYAQGPFIVEGLLYGIFGAVLAIILLYPFSIWANPLTESFFGGDGLLSYYSSEFFRMSSILIIVGSLIGIVSSAVSIRKYLK